MKKFLLCSVICIFCLHGFSQTLRDNYQAAYVELSDMLEGKTTFSLKRAVFITENAYLNNELVYDDFSKHIEALASFAKLIAAKNDLKYTHKDREQVLLSASIYRLMKDTLFIQANDQQSYRIIPFTYDMEDFWGERDWTKMFVTKLLSERTGNCHSLPILYKILADELGTEAWLAVAPNHIYVKQWSEKTGWYNTELTTGRFPFDADIKWNSYIKTEAIASGVYMDTLSRNEMLSLVLTDLAQGYVKKSGRSDLQSPRTWLATAIKVYPDNINALILAAELNKSQYEEVMDERSVAQFSALWKDPVMKEQFKKIETEYLRIHDLGYRKMPKEMYLNWLFRIKNDTTQKPFQFTSPQPFKSYNYNVTVVTAGTGENYEFFDQEDVVNLGTVELNIRKRKIVSFIPVDKQIPDEIVSRMYDPALGRWWVVDRLSEKYYNMSPYNFVANNPILYVDPNGDSISLNQTAQGGISGFQNIVSQGSGGFYNAGVDPNTGIVTMTATGQEGTITKSQQKFVDEMTKLTTSNGVATVNVANNSENVVIGDIANKTMDVGDMQKLGNDGKVTAQKALVHELTENYGVQVKGQTPIQGHMAGGNAENRLGGPVLSPLDRNITPSTSLPGLSTLTVPVLGPGSQKGAVNITLYKNNVLFVSGNTIVPLPKIVR